MPVLPRRETDDTPKAFKSPAANRILASSLVLAIALLIAGVASPKLHVIGPVFAVVNLAVGVRIWMMGVYLRSDGVRIVNFHSAETVAWDDVERFEIAPLAQYRHGAISSAPGTAGDTDRRSDRRTMGRRSSSSKERRRTQRSPEVAPHGPRYLIGIRGLLAVVRSKRRCASQRFDDSAESSP